MESIATIELIESVGICHGIISTERETGTARKEGTARLGPGGVLAHHRHQLAHDATN